MTVSFLRRQQQQPAFSSSSAAVNHGFSRCVHDIVHFLSKDEVKTQSQRKLLNHFQNLQPSSDENRRESVLAQLSSTEQQIISKEKTSVKSFLWRPCQSVGKLRKEESQSIRSSTSHREILGVHRGVDTLMDMKNVSDIDPNIRQQICSLYRVTTFPDSHSVLYESISITPPLHLLPETWILSSARRTLSMWQLYIPHCVSKLSHLLQTVRNSNKPKTHTFIWRFGSINRGDAASTNQTHSTQRDLQHRDTAMAPTITSAMNISNEQLPLNNKLRKPMVEKMRRDRINQQPDSKLEKGDIVEMTVSFLRCEQQQQQPAFFSSSAVANQGFSRCVHDIVHLLSKEEVRTQSQRKLLNHFQNLQPSSDENRRESVLAQLSSTEQQIISKEKTSVKSSLWRPW
ncbi:hypothetical protein Q7C36_020897 [Tachysurus vachellii]|uniref:Orange domain-containing protein n=1 Tax=Tachysurus vachellii TaxID=175792 RepID=A0AA88IVW8_TACVA|nr:hypothetical protein Q7C36_020897 [Tachysurus vachellii]